MHFPMGIEWIIILVNLLPVAIFGGIIYLVVHLIKKHKKDRPLMLLKERYVRGEITEEEYQQKRKTLNAD